MLVCHRRKESKYPHLLFSSTILPPKNELRQPQQIQNKNKSWICNIEHKYANKKRVTIHLTLCPNKILCTSIEQGDPLKKKTRSMCQDYGNDLKWMHVWSMVWRFSRPHSSDNIHSTKLFRQQVLFLHTTYNSTRSTTTHCDLHNSGERYIQTDYNMLQHAATRCNTQ